MDPAVRKCFSPIPPTVKSYNIDSKALDLADVQE